jgi:5-oxopent-3-ene-1,2,5-tricarboxylate decarboxylase/2-hydroxyhepta-2,4-diene-1,7-dioate isomerase
MLHYKTRKNDQVINLQAKAPFEVALEGGLLPAVNGASTNR